MFQDQAALLGHGFVVGLGLVAGVAGIKKAPKGTGSEVWVLGATGSRTGRTSPGPGGHRGCLSPVSSSPTTFGVEVLDGLKFQL